MDEPKDQVPAKTRSWLRPLLWLSGWLITLALVGTIAYRTGRDHAVTPRQSKLQVSPFDGRSFYEEDSDRDGRPDAQHFVDKEGRYLETRIDRNEDGIPELSRFYHVDGHVTREEQDTDYDGQMDRWEDLDAAGVTTHAKYDLDGDGQPDSESFHDEEGALAKTVTTRDGKIAEETHYEDDLATRSLVDLDRDGVLETEVLYDDLGIFRDARKIKRP